MRSSIRLLILGGILTLPSTVVAYSGINNLKLHYIPPCASKCLYAIIAPLNCTVSQYSPAMQRREGIQSKLSGANWMIESPASQQCQRVNKYFLQSLSYCIYEYCKSVPLHMVEAFWNDHLYGNKTGQQPQQVRYREALQAALTDPLRQPLDDTALLDYTAIVSKEQFLLKRDAKSPTAEETSGRQSHSRIAFSLLLLCIIPPVLISAGVFISDRLLCCPQSLFLKIEALFVNPPLLTFSSKMPVWMLSSMPTRGQGLILAYFSTLNVIATLYSLSTEGAREPGGLEPFNFISRRLGAISCANMTLVVLYAGRNNILLWLTTWSRSTFLLLHRWVALLSVCQGCLHGSIYLYIYTHADGYNYNSMSQSRSWIWGTVAVVNFVCLLFFSLQPLRERIYESFILLHMIFCTVCLASVFLHILYHFKSTTTTEYMIWLCVTAGIWTIDRVSRLIRTLKNGFLYAQISTIDENYFSIRISDINCHGHAYLHFPTLSTWRLWESHPFSVAAVSLTGAIPTGGEPSREIESSTTFLVRKHTGMTAVIAERMMNQLPVLVETNYGFEALLSRHTEITPTVEFPKVLYIAGGVGITSILPTLHSLTQKNATGGTIKLYWNVRSHSLVHVVESLLQVDSCRSTPDYRSRQQYQWGNVETILSIGKRMKLEEIISNEFPKPETLKDEFPRSGGTLVVACGPIGMINEARCLISHLCQEADQQLYKVRLVVESSTW